MDGVLGATCPPCHALQPKRTLLEHRFVASLVTALGGEQEACNCTCKWPRRLHPVRQCCKRLSQSTHGVSHTPSHQASLSSTPSGHLTGAPHSSALKSSMSSGASARSTLNAVPAPGSGAPDAALMVSQSLPGGLGRQPLFHPIDADQIATAQPQTQMDDALLRRGANWRGGQPRGRAALRRWRMWRAARAGGSDARDSSAAGGSDARDGCRMGRPVANGSLRLRRAILLHRWCQGC